MIGAWIPYLVFLGLFWFFLYWIVGGVLFAIVAFSRVTKLRRALFSTLFTLGSFFIGFAAAFFGALSAQDAIQVCFDESTDVFGRMASVIACGVLEHAFTGMIGFFGVLLVGLISFALARANNQSWIDSDPDMEHDPFF